MKKTFCDECGIELEEDGSNLMGPCLFHSGRLAVRIRIDFSECTAIGKDRVDICDVCSLRALRDGRYEGPSMELIEKAGLQR